ncbi:hypothetical protein TeGR_g3241 [Tetraparma gracilis]|uniref:Uncharacterized protein n=1 Tax=Tetraparma gracilis TaxID=2962635 RepID=A0ABQ6M513_9STRA|nr:hypothetical protein TeGR_g3241 [Tetraparma gracilis]
MAAPAAAIQAQEMLADADVAASATAQVVLAAVFLHAGELAAALKIASAGTTLEHLALAVQIQLRLERADLARQSLALMVRADEDAPLTQLAAAQVATAGGAASARDAVYALTTLSEQYGPSVPLLNALAAAKITAGDHQGALSSLSAALAASAELPSPPPSLPDTYANLLAVLARTDQGKAAGVLEKFRGEFPDHPYVRRIGVLEGAFDRVKGQFK